MAGLKWILLPFFVSLMALSVGCTHRQLRYDHVMQARSITTIYEQQVLDNLAMFSSEPNSLPFFAIPTTGSANVTDGGQISAGPLNGPVRTVIGPLNLSRGNAQGWTLVPVTDFAKLERMQLLYQEAIASKIVNNVSGIRTPSTECTLKGSYCGCSVQVCKENRAAFTRLVLTVLDYALNDPPAQPAMEATPTVEVQDLIYNDDATVKQIRKYNVNSSEIDVNAVGVANGGTSSGSSSRTFNTPSVTEPLSSERARVNSVIREQQRQVLRGSLFPN